MPVSSHPLKPTALSPDLAGDSLNSCTLSAQVYGHEFARCEGEGLHCRLRDEVISLAASFDDHNVVFVNATYLGL